MSSTQMIVTSQSIITLFLAIAVMLAAALAMREVARLLRQPAILGEIMAGILLGPTLLGRIAPDLSAALFPARGVNTVALQAITMLALVLFLLVAGMELELSAVLRQGRKALYISLAGMIIPFALGFSAAWFLPELMGIESGAHRHDFALFIATALSISALPVIARTLIDLGLYRSDLGMLVVVAAILNDLAGWIIFAILLGLLGQGRGFSVGQTVCYTLAYACFMLTLGRWAINRALPWIQSRASYPAGVLGAAFVLALFGAALTESIGIHAIFGSFLVGVAVGDSSHLREQTRTTLRQFISFIFAPLFFVSIGMKVDFIAHFDLRLSAIVLLIACVGKILGCGLCARLGGMATREAWAVGFGLNARGAMEIILGMLALEYGLIGQSLFVALVIMALVTSMMSGPAMMILLRRRTPHRLANFLSARAFLSPVRAANRREAVRELSQVAAPLAGLSAQAIDHAVWTRTETMSTALEPGVAIPHAALEGLTAPVVVVGVSREGIDFNSPEGLPAQLIFLLLTPPGDGDAQLEIQADIARLFSDPERRGHAAQVENYVEFLALVRSGEVRD